MILRRYFLGLNIDVVRDLAEDIVEERVAVMIHCYFVTDLLYDDNLLYARSLLNRLVTYLLQLDHVPSTQSSVGRDEELGVRVHEPFCQRICAEAGEDYSKACAQSGCRQHHHRKLRDHREVESDRVALLDPVALAENVRDPVHLVIEVAVGELADLSRSVLVDGLALPDHGHLVPAPRSEVSVQAELGRVELSACEPFVEGRVGIVENPAPRLVPFQFLGYTGPEIGRASCRERV